MREPLRYSFVITCYNYENVIAKAVDSIINQFSPDSVCYEVIIVDDGSTDNSKRIVRTLSEMYSQVSYFSQQNAGPSSARNAGAGMARGKYLWFIDADDQLVPNAIETMAEAIDKSPQAAMIYTGYRSHALNGRVVEKIAKRQLPSKEKIFLDCVTGQLKGLCIGSSIINREIFLKHKFPVSVRSGEDPILYAHIIANNEVASFPGIVINTYRHKDSLRMQNVKTILFDEQAVEILFDEKVLSPTLMGFKNRYKAFKYLEVARAFYLAKRYSQVRENYRKAIEIDLFSISKLSYLRKYIKAVIKDSTSYVV